MGRKARQALLFAGIAVSAATVVIAAFHHISNLTRMELFADDVRTVASTYAHREPQDPRVVIVGITEDTLTQFPYRSPVDRGFLANLLRLLQDRGASVIGLDVLLDQATEPEKDEELKATIAGLKVPLFVSYTANPEFVDQDQLDYLNAFVPPRVRARAEVGTDLVDGVTRWIDLGQSQTDGTYMPGLAAAVAGSTGAAVPTRPVPREHIIWHGQPNGDTPPFLILPAHAVPVLPAAWIKDKVVLLGEMVTL
ncbi:MAG: CHASE2 domain-containing protein, partial [Alphaproteobacteria bacterium]|nr:CHASE2 domain-containing protein [Alphaproteobacteria bacterium]